MAVSFFVESLIDLLSVSKTKHNLITSKVLWGARLFLTIPIKKSRTISSTVAVTLGPNVSPQKEIPRMPKSHPPSTAPRTAMTIFPRIPKPPSLRISPASQPATPPIKRL